MFSLHSGSEDGRSIGFEKSGVLGSPDQSLIVLSVKLLSASNDTECVFPRVVLSPGINCLPGNDCSPVIFHWRVNLGGLVDHFCLDSGINRDYSSAPRATLMASLFKFYMKVGEPSD